ncbi:MAG: ester cyclase [Myxococcaceae bacterium]|nr:ester cyclase [Myxococcaceae bacterium]
MASRHEEIVRRWIDEGFSKGNVALADALVAEGLIAHTALPGQSSGREGLKKAVSTLRAAFPDLAVRIDDLISEGDRVAVRDEIIGTHQGTFNGIAATGRKVSVGRISFYKLKDGQIAETWSQLDMAGLMRQLTSPTA